MLLKDYKPKYKMIELIENQDEFPFIKNMFLINIANAQKQFGDREVLSVKDYDDTRTTSIIMSEGENQKC